MTRWTLPLIAVIGALVGAALVWRFDRVAGARGVEQVRVERIVRNYVLANPEIIPEAMQRFRDRETGKTIAANRAAIFSPVGNAWTGNPDGDVTLVEYFDYNCGFCRASLPTIDKLVARDPKLRIVFRDLPVLSEASGVAAQLGIAAALAGRFKPFHDALYAGGPLTDVSIATAIRATGLDPTKLGSASRVPLVAAQIRTNLKLAHELGMTGTPAWVVGDRVLAGALPIDTLEQAVAAARGK